MWNSDEKADWWTQMGLGQNNPFDLTSFMFEDEDLDIEEDDDEVIEAALLPLRDLVVFPRAITPLFVGRDRSVEALKAATENEERLIVVTQRDVDVVDPGPEDLYTTGTEVSTGRLLHMPDGSLSVLSQGHRRVQIVEYLQLEPYMRVRAVPVLESKEKPPLTEALMRAVLALFEKVVQLNRSLPEDAYVFAMNIDEPGWLGDLMGQVLDLEPAERQELLETLDPATRLQRVSVLLAKELDVLELEDRIHSQVQQEVDRTQREYFLREQMKVIQNELGESDIYTQELSDLRQKVGAANMPDEVRAKAERELERLASMPPMAPEVGIIRTYLDWLIDLPWTDATEDRLDIKHAEKVLESRHYGLPKAKERILEYLAVRQLAQAKMRSPILCFTGPPGTGKTSLGQSIAQAMDRNFVRVSLGGVRDEAEIRGHRRTYIGALPGRVIQTMRRAGTINPVFMLDEIDKLGYDFRGDPSAALLEVLDPEQNNAFSDHYLDVSYDLSKVLFITTANSLDTVPPALRDRMEVIEFSGYIEEEKLEIANRFLIPRQIEENGLQEHPIHFGEPVLRTLIREYTYEAGVRNLEREIGSVCRKAARRLAEARRPLNRVTPRLLEKYLGPPRFLRDAAEEQAQVGVAMGIAWTDAGGALLPVEVALMPGKGGLTLTGQLGEVMQESAQAAFSFTRSYAEGLKVDPEIFEKTDIHIHIPEGAIPKDGPSAGITMATALISAFTGAPVRHDLSMTGEITLRGRVLPVGGLKEKLLAAHRVGIKTVLVPARNKKDMNEIPKRVLHDLNVVFVEHMSQVLETALLVPEPEPKPRQRRKRVTAKSEQPQPTTRVYN